MKRLVVIFIIILLNVMSYSSDFIPRSEHRAMLEPLGLVVNGAGQSPDAFANYWNVIGENHKPIVYMYYVGLKGVQQCWAMGLKWDLMKYFDNFVIPQIGLSITYDGNPSLHYEDEVAAGLHDGAIYNFLDGLEQLAFPVYLRIGYEFNGLGWNGYQPKTYKQAFIRIVQKIRERDLEISAVWCSSADGETNFMDYYPGDEFVDW